VWVVALAACGRVGFDARGDAGSPADGASDAAADVASDALPADLVAWIPLDDGSLQDLAGGPAGVCQGACTTFVAGHAGMALHFDGSTTCVAFEDLGQFRSPNITIAIWANEDNPLAQRECQVSKRVDIAGTPYNSWQLETTATVDQESFTSNHGATGNDQLIASTVIQPDLWQHIVATYDGATVRLYVDGVLRNSQAQSPLAYDTKPAILGCDDNNGMSEHFQGALDELRVYDRALSQSEVQALP
jgi:hypothetical protein